VNPFGTSIQRSTFPASRSSFAFRGGSISAKTSLGHPEGSLSSTARSTIPRRVAKRGASGPLRTSDSGVADCRSSLVFNPVRTPRELDRATSGYVIIGNRSVTATVLRSRKNSSKSRRASAKAAQKELALRFIKVPPARLHEKRHLQVLQHFQQVHYGCLQRRYVLYR